MSNLPKTIKRTKYKKFTEKRSPYKAYLDAKWSWSDIFIEIDELKKTSIDHLKVISKKYGIVYSTLANKYTKYCNNEENIMVNINNENRGGSNKTFSDETEKELYEHIKTNFIDKNRPLTNEIIKQIALKNIIKDIMILFLMQVTDGVHLLKRNGI